MRRVRFFNEHGEEHMSVIESTRGGMTAGQDNGKGVQVSNLTSSEKDREIKDLMWKLRLDNESSGELAKTVLLEVLQAIAAGGTVAIHPRSGGPTILQAIHRKKR